MTTTNLDQVLDQVKSLSLDEQRQLRDILNTLLAKAGPQMTDEEFQLRLLEKGIIGRIPPRIRDEAFYQNRKPVEVEGKPVSEIIIEERR
jgi:hypothetical protein